MSSRLAAFALGALQSHAIDAGDLLLPADDACSFDDSSCALSLLQHQTRKKNRHSRHTIASGVVTKSDPVTYVTKTPTPESPWPEFEAGGLWDFDVPKTPVKIVGWTGMGMVMNTKALSIYFPQCTYSDVPHGRQDRSVWHGFTTGMGEFVITDPDTDISDADVVLFYLPYFMRTNVLPSTKRPGQLWIATCGEALERPETDMDCSFALDKEFMKHFDGFSGYHGSADFLDPHVKLFPAYQDPPDAEMLKMTPPGWTNFQAMGDDLVTLALSDCDSGERNDWISRVVDQFESRDRGSALVSYGKCFHNREETGKECSENILKWYDPWSNRCSSRSFKLVAENRVDSWYVTEKVWDALWEGAVPIYFGPPEVKYLVPPGSIIYYADFASPEELVDYILDFDEGKLAAARSWRNLPESEWGNFTHTRRHGHQSLLPRFCAAGAEAKAAQESLAVLSTHVSTGDKKEQAKAADKDGATKSAAGGEGVATAESTEMTFEAGFKAGFTERGEAESEEADKSQQMIFEVGFKAGYQAALKEVEDATK